MISERIIYTSHYLLHAKHDLLKYKRKERYGEQSIKKISQKLVLVEKGEGLALKIKKSTIQNVDCFEMRGRQIFKVSPMD